MPPEAKINKLATSLESRYLVAAGETPFLYVFDLRIKKEYNSYRIPSGCDSVKELSFIPDSRLAILGNDDQVYIIDISKGLTVILKKNLLNKAVISFSIDIFGKYMLCISNTGEVYLYDVSKLLLIEES